MSQLSIPWDSPSQPPRRRTAALSSFKPTGQDVEESLAGERRAQRQEIRLVEWLRTKPPGTRVTPWDAAEALGWCINSTRRAMSVLTDAGILQDWPQDRRPAGPYGQRSRTWSLRPPADHQTRAGEPAEEPETR